MQTRAPDVVLEQTQDSIAVLHPSSSSFRLSSSSSSVGPQRGSPCGRLAAAAATGMSADAITGVAMAAIPNRPALRRTARRLTAFLGISSTSRSAD